MSGYLCEDLISEIFERLPPKSLLRFRSLSTSWFSFISSRSFIHRHTRRSEKTPQKCLKRHTINRDDNDFECIYALGLLERNPLCPRSRRLDVTAVKFPDRNTEIVGSCNGILCLYDYNEERCFILWNFSIRRKLTLPDYPFSDYSKGSHVGLGIGFDPVTDDYKIVLISYSRYKGVAQSTVLSSMKTGSWSEIASTSISSFHVKSQACCFNGVLHWVVKCNLTESSTRRHHIIMTFDLSTHVFGTITLPEPSWVTTRVMIYNGSLAVISRKDDIGMMWVMREYNDVASWSVNFKRMNKSKKLKDRSCSCNIEMAFHVESLELLDKGTPYGETFVTCTDKDTEKEKTENSKSDYQVNDLELGRMHLDCDSRT